MGYAYYQLPDGREAGYGVEAECDHSDCEARIDRGLGYLCGDKPDGHREFDAPGCGKYFCPSHMPNHACANPECGTWDESEDLCCRLVKGHDLPHMDTDTNESFGDE